MQKKTFGNFMKFRLKIYTNMQISKKLVNNPKHYGLFQA